MSLLVTLTADILVAVLLVATIVSSLRLSRKIAGFKADESAMRQTIGQLVSATASAERAIGGLRAALDECDRTLTDRLEEGGRTCAALAAHVEAGASVVARIGAIVAQAGAARAAPARPVEPVQAANPAAKPVAMTVAMPATKPATKPIAASGPAPQALGNGERLSATLAAAQALSERALDRIRAKAA